MGSYLMYNPPMRPGRLLILVLLLRCGSASAQAPSKSINPTIQKIVEAVSEERIAASMRKLESFETRSTMSQHPDPNHGTEAARRWLLEEFRSYSPRLQVRLDSYKVKKQGVRIIRDVDVVNVVAVLPGRRDPERQFIISAHYDTMHLIRRPGASRENEDVEPPEIDGEKTAGSLTAPGVSDDASGIAAVLELARVLSRYEFDATLVFIAFDAEEQGLIGSNLYSAKARQEKQRIEAVLNNDIIGTEVAGDGRVENRRVRVFSEEPSDSPSRNLARYIKEIGERYVPAMTVDLIFRHDRFARGGDHTSFNLEGFPAVRFTSAAENYSQQHTATDTFAHAAPGYTTKVARINAAALASLALAPPPPDVTRISRSGLNSGRVVPNIGRGKTGYAALLRWKSEKPPPDLAGYAVVMRSTLAPYWEREIFVGNVQEHLIEGVSIDEMVFGVKAIDKDGHESLVSAYVATVPVKRPVETY
jgi:hypothetical protein